MKKSFMLFMFTLILVIAGCSSGGDQTGGDTVEEDDTITIVWYPNESGAEMKTSRDAIAAVIADATGKTVEHETTTDYIIAIESIANGNADIAFMGAQGYIEAHTKNEKVLPLVVPSGSSGTLDDAVYHSWLASKTENADEYKDGSEFSIDNIVGKKFSFVSNSSTSGFRVPSEGIISHFSEQDEYKDLTADDLIENGNFFSEVLFGGSHQGSAVNLLSGQADVAAFCDSCVGNYVELSEGEENTAGAVYKVKEDAAEPFNTVPGEEFTVLSVTPVLNAPIVANTENLSQETIDTIVEALTSEETASNEDVFATKESGKTSLFKKTDKEQFVAVEDEWFDPIRELSK
ncbi:PhnD/SsuA/transferrin family substrate-binding protein [Bacillaceae bacterium Marseille-Q3522]|nr:PhnD/SsuA/transferrin family substrate-binding protein [Bacillaceae bacterium Marseille-Q3522]